jgi:antitoxin HicB
VVYHFKIQKEADGYWAECIELKGCLTQGDDLEEIAKNAAEALNLYLSEPEESRLLFPLPRKRINQRGKIIKVAVEPGVALSLLLKHIRAKRGLTQTRVATMLGFANLYSYQKLESPKLANPELKTLSRLKTVFPELNLEDLVG